MNEAAHRMSLKKNQRRQGCRRCFCARWHRAEYEEEGYIRIEHEAGGATHLAMSESNSGAIDKVADESIASVGMMRAQMRRAYKRRK